jgi:hypothetical protein
MPYNGRVAGFPSARSYLAGDCDGKENQTAGGAGIQVFELTMDNPEDQDELNRRLQKPGEPNWGPAGQIGCPAHGGKPGAEVEAKPTRQDGVSS